MTRFENWPEILAQFVAERARTPFAWGVNDCCLMSCDAVLGYTGVDMAAGFRGKYDSGLSAARAMKEFCGGGVEQVAEKMAAQLNIPEWPTVKLARRGDVVLFEYDGEFRGERVTQRATLGICCGGDAVVPAQDGLLSIPISQCRRAWRIG
jgi:hypothetical protein